jgi:hypothetical protein
MEKKGGTAPSVGEQVEEKVMADRVTRILMERAATDL